jgi:DNA-binding NtrC family response regulator
MRDCIIIVDDDSDEIDWITSALNTLDSEVKCLSFNEAKVAMNHMKAMEKKPLAVILDLNMPEISGLEILRNMQDPVRNKQIHVIIHSCTEPPEKIMAEITSLGGSFIIKPYTYTDYRETFRSLLLNWRLPTA